MKPAVVSVTQFHAGSAQDGADGDLPLARLAAPGWLAPGAWVAIELHGERPALPDALTPSAERRFGKAEILLLRREGAG